MTIHPDILADLVVLYHAGEASEATRTLLEAEAARNPEIAAALSSGSIDIPLLPGSPAPEERKVLRKVRLRYQAFSFAAAWLAALIAIAVLPRFASPGAGVATAINLIPFAVLLLFFAGLTAALYFAVRVLFR